MTPEQFEQLADIFPEPALLVTRSGTVLAANRAVQELGWSVASLRGRPLVELTATEPDRVRDYLRLCARSGDPVPVAFDFVDESGHLVP